MQLLLFIVCLFATWSIRATFLYAIDASIAPEGLRTVDSVTVKLILWVLPAFGYVYWVRRASPLRYLGISIMPSARKWLKYLVVIGLFLGAQVAFQSIVDGKAPTLAGLSVSITVPGVLTLIVSPFLEELLFRGLLLHELAALLPRWVANLLTSLLFAGIHLPFWLSHGGLSATMLTNTGRRFHLQPVGRVALSGQLVDLAADRGAHCQQLRRGIIDGLRSLYVDVPILPIRR